FHIVYGNGNVIMLNKKQDWRWRVGLAVKSPYYFAEDLSSVPSSHAGGLTIPYNSSSGRYNVLFCALRAFACACTHTKI
ncbi:hypothetical protein ACQP3F_31235, partial [Escherichia coli]